MNEGLGGKSREERYITDLEGSQRGVLN